ncbi:3-oxo-5-alpha-steroid 4-dehydrogenase, C-terminal [Dillenia turbinata]|uniref:Steroid 5-alpha-reductase DET2 n=1 Tax=Dillenia turbinata TaxID=194707 RepID=A0AAN8VYA7_9MAGN
MESPTLWLILILFPFGRHRSNPKALILITPFIFHYVHRTCIYPLRLKPSTKPKTLKGFPLSVALMAFGFNFLNSYLQARWVSHYMDYETERFFWVRIIVGLLIFGVGMVVNVRSDLILVGLKGEDGGYKVPRGGMFELVSCANYFGEILEWLGWAVMGWSWVSFGFLVYTCANLVPRARANHKWYLEKFGEDYPKQRKAVIPFLY